MMAKMVAVGMMTIMTTMSSIMMPVMTIMARSTIVPVVSCHCQLDI